MQEKRSPGQPRKDPTKTISFRIKESKKDDLRKTFERGVLSGHFEKFVDELLKQ